jgi:hypothetical protein
LDEANELLAIVIVARLEEYLSRVMPGLQESQYCFRRWRSTTDAIARVHSLVEEVEQWRWVPLAMSLDIVNSFNSVPWGKIEEVPELHRVLLYLRSRREDCRYCREFSTLLHACLPDSMGSGKSTFPKPGDSVPLT